MISKARKIDYGQKHFNDIQKLWNVDKTKDKNAKRDISLILEEISKYLEGNYYFRCMKDNEELFNFDEKENTWCNDTETLLKQEIDCIIPTLTTYQKNEIINKIKCRNYNDRKDFNPSHLTGFENCVLDIEKWTLIPHSHKNLLTKKIAIEYKPECFPDRFEKFFDQVIPEKDRNLILEMMAHTLLNDYRFQKAFVLNGEGANGKSTLLGVLSSFLGENNITAYTLQNFEKNQFAASKLFGKMANIAPDISSKALYNTQNFKILTGGDYGEHNIKGKQSIIFINSAILIFSCNTLPAIYEDTHAIWRRLCVIDFVKTILPKDQDENLLTKLTTKEELSGILNVLLVALKRLVDRGHFEGLKSILDTREEYIMKSDVIHAFCDNCLEYADNEYETSDDLFREQCLYAEAIGIQPKTKQSLTKQLLLWKPKAYDGTIKRGKKKVRVWRGIKINNWREEIEK